MHGPAVLAMLVADGHLDELRQGPLDRWQRLSVLLGKPGEAEDEGPFTATGRRAIISAQESAGRPEDDALWTDDARRRVRRLPAAAAQFGAAQLVAEQISLIAADGIEWSTEGHRAYPPRFRAAVRALLLSARRPECVLAKLPGDAMLHLCKWLAERWFWDVPSGREVTS